MSCEAQLPHVDELGQLTESTPAAAQHLAQHVVHPVGVHQLFRRGRSGDAQRGERLVVVPAQVVRPPYSVWCARVCD
jgi:hypothetical protein